MALKKSQFYSSLWQSCDELCGGLKDGNKNRLRAQGIHKIVDVFNKQTEWPRYSRMVPVAEIASPANDYNLDIPRYIDSSAPEDLHDLDAHLNGSIPNRDIDALGVWWDYFPSLRKVLFKRNRKGYGKARVDARQVKATILDNSEFQDYECRVRFRELMDRLMPQWRLYGDELDRTPLAHEDWRY